MGNSLSDDVDAQAHAPVLDDGLIPTVSGDGLAHRASVLSIVARGVSCPDKIAEEARLPLEETQITLVWLERGKMIELFPGHGHLHARPTTGTKMLFKDAKPKRRGLWFRLGRALRSWGSRKA